jgi:hypothetical protein
MPNNRPSRPYDLSPAWGFAVAAAIIIIIMIGWGWTGQGRGWGRNNQLAHIMPPAAVSSSNGPASRSNSASANWH